MYEELYEGYVWAKLGPSPPTMTFPEMSAGPCLVTTRGRYRSVSGPGEYTPFTPALGGACAYWGKASGGSFEATVSRLGHPPAVSAHG